MAMLCKGSCAAGSCFTMPMQLIINESVRGVKFPADNRCADGEATGIINFTQIFGFPIEVFCI